MSDAEDTIKYIIGDPPLKISCGKVYRIVVTPPCKKVCCLRLTGILFELNKSFILPGAIQGLKKIKEIYDEHPGAEVLVVGHTDTSGQDAYNETLSVERAESVKDFLSDNVAGWEKFYEFTVSDVKRWGRHEDTLMISTLDEYDAKPDWKDPIMWYQECKNVTQSGSMTKDLRKQLITDYMNQDETSLPEESRVVSHGCGEYFPQDPTGDGVRDIDNRRVEIFFFDDVISPEPPGQVSKRDSQEYPEWIKQTEDTQNMEIPDPPELFTVRLHDNMSKLMPNTYFVAKHGERVLMNGQADSQGFIKIPVPSVAPEKINVLWGATDIGDDLLYEMDFFINTDPADTDQRNKIRLHNLGYPGESNLEWAVILFQDDYQVDNDPEPVGLQDGVLPDATQQYLDNIFKEEELNFNAETPG